MTGVGYAGAAPLLRLSLEHGDGRQSYSYDAAGRLTQVADTVGEDCTTRRYTIDGGGAGNSNRSKLEKFGPGTGGAD